MPNTTYSGLPYPVLGVPPNIPQDFSNLATALDQKVITTVASAAARTALSSKYDGMIVREASTDRFYVWDSTASAWVYLYGGITPPVLVSLAGGWYHYSASFGNNREYLHLAVSSGEVRLRGLIGNTSVFSTSAIMVNAGGIPTAYRTQVSALRFCDGQAGSSTPIRQPVTVAADGSVTITPTVSWAASSIFSFDMTWNMLDGITS